MKGHVGKRENWGQIFKQKRELDTSEHFIFFNKNLCVKKLKLLTLKKVDRKAVEISTGNTFLHQI